MIEPNRPDIPWYRRQPTYDLLVALVVLTGVLGNLTAIYRNVTARDEAYAVAATIGDANRDAILLSRYWQDVQTSAAHLQMLAADVSRARMEGDNVVMNRALADLRVAVAASMPGIRRVMEADAQGVPIWSTWPTPLPGSLTSSDLIPPPPPGRDIFTADSPSIPGYPGRSLWLIKTRRAPNGTVQGLYVVAFDMALAQAIIQEAVHRDGDIATVTRDHQIVVARSDGKNIGRGPVSGPAAYERPTGTDYYVRRGPSPIDGRQRIAVMRDVPGGDLSIVVGVDEQNALSGLHARQPRQSAVFMLLCGLIVAAAVMILLQRQRSREIARAGQHATARGAADQMLREIAARSPDIMAVLDRDLRYIYINDAIRDHLGAEPSSFIGRKIGSRVMRDEIVRLTQTMGDMVSSREARTVTFPMLRADETTVWMEFVLSPIRLPDEDGVLQGCWLYTGRDVTARRNAEEGLRLAHEELKLILDNLPIQFYRIDPKARIYDPVTLLPTNRGSLLGYSAALSRDLNFISGLVHPDDRHIYAGFAKSLADNRTGLAEYRMRHADGHYIWLRTYAVVSARPGGGDEVIGYSQDITAEKAAEARAEAERIAAERALREVHEDLRMMTDNVPGFLYRSAWRGDDQVRLLIASDKAENLFGFTKEDWAQPGFYQSRVHPDDADKSVAFRQTILVTGEARMEIRLLPRNGPYVWLRIVASCQTQPDGLHVSVGFALDVTAEKEQAEKLAEARQLLAIGELASGIGHELGQPLMAIALAAQNAARGLARNPADTARALEKLERIQEMTDRAGDIIAKMRELGHPERQKTARIDPREVVASALSVTADRLERDGIRTEIALPEDLPRVVVAPLLFQQALINLIANAADAYRELPPGAATDRIIAISAHTADRKLVLRVSDRAGGIPDDLAGRIFEPFFTTKRDQHGTGLGLALAHRIIHGAGGELTVRTENGGSVFEITLPAAGPDSAA